MATQQQKGEAFRALHEGEPFIIPNPWDAGTAKVMAALGFEALATTSGGFAFTLGRLDGEVTLDEVIEHTRVLAEATEIPVSVDLENGHGHEPEQAASAIKRAAEAGAVGGSIEDWDRAERLYELEEAAERVAPPRRRRGPSTSPSPSPPAPRTTCAAIPTWTTPSLACRPTRRPARMSSTRRRSATSRRSRRSATPSRNRSTCSRARRSRWPR